MRCCLLTDRKIVDFWSEYIIMVAAYDVYETAHEKYTSYKYIERCRMVCCVK